MPKPTDWDVVAANPEFRALMRAKARFIVPGDPLLHRLLLRPADPRRLRAGLHGDARVRPRQHRLPVRALAVFMAWFIACLYVRAAARFDEQDVPSSNTSTSQSSRGATLMSTPLLMFLVFIAITLGITYLGRAPLLAAPAPTSPPGAASPAGRTASPSPAIT